MKTAEQRLKDSISALLPKILEPKVGIPTEDEKRQWEALSEPAKDVSYGLFVLKLTEVIFENGEPQVEVKGERLTLTHKMQRTMVWRIRENDPLMMEKLMLHPASREFVSLVESGVF